MSAGSHSAPSLWMCMGKYTYTCISPQNNQGGVEGRDHKQTPPAGYFTIAFTQAQRQSSLKKLPLVLIIFNHNAWDLLTNVMLLGKI